MCGQYTLRDYSPCVFTIAGNGSNGNAGEESLAVWEGGGEGTYRKEAYKKKRGSKECVHPTHVLLCVCLVVQKLSDNKCSYLALHILFKLL